jgi:hypothetical protein
MDKLPPWLMGIARASIASFLAWALVMQVAAAAPWARGVGDVATISAQTERCATGDGDHRPAHDRRSPCVCCVAGRSSLLDELAGLAQPLSNDATVPLSTVRIIRAGAERSVVAAAPLGWIGSWSQRAPPAGFSTVSPLRFLAA